MRCRTPLFHPKAALTEALARFAPEEFSRALHWLYPDEEIDDA
jgi:hypothetical protein